ncbi:2-dehydropantoate 2-reductase [Pseudorhodoferax sp. Leaf274]|uniref:2-dehydropantoate 2-reductase n=1 Tax=Pseudorhodoferax sp. Leaf274 TaxID=1736318 RepID=UPI00070311A2|nr:2-dehydropantoate 2-reductase [Pseudorhodoferax sp. Leaf274]KQP49636.1 2-dehydropantoate 2-reductase [Pseudorhodoferax sp. Leaf274]
MPVRFDRVCVFGAGAIGGWIGARLAQAGCDLSAVARGETLAALQAHGLRLDQGGQTLAAPVRASADPADLGVQDLVLVAVKAPAMAQVAQRIAPLLGPETVVLTAMNGVPWWFFQGFGGAYAGRTLESVDPGRRIAAAIPAETVLGCIVHASCALHGPGFVKHHFGNQLILGEPAGGASERVQALAALLARAGIETQVADQIQKDCWYKLWGNMTVNPISAITGATTDRIMDDDLVRGLVTQVMLEAKEIGARIGIPIAQQPEDRHAVTRKLGAFKTSMLQDVEAGRPVELDALVGAVRELGQITQAPTPFTDALFGLARLHARGRGLY